MDLVPRGNDVVAFSEHLVKHTRLDDTGKEFVRGKKLAYRSNDALPTIEVHQRRKMLVEVLLFHREVASARGKQPHRISGLAQRVSVIVGERVYVTDEKCLDLVLGAHRLSTY